MNPELFQFHAAAALGLSGSQPPTSGVNPGEARGCPPVPHPVSLVEFRPLFELVSGVSLSAHL